MKVDWENYFLNIAQVVKTRSPDTKVQVGCVLVSLDNNRIISTGYNGIPSGLNEKNIDWNNREYIRSIIIHAETNAILYAQSKFINSILYTTMSPCSECIKLLSATKIKKIIYQNEYKDIQNVKELCKFFQIELKQIN